MGSDRLPDRQDTLPTVAPTQSSGADIARFVADARSLERPAAERAAGRGRLVLALDATMSRQPAWDLACQIQSEMFDAAGVVGGLEVQLAYFRGQSECRSSRFATDTNELKRLMSRIECRGGQTQIGRILAHVLAETEKAKVSAAVYIGDAMEENVDALADKAARLGLAGVPLFVFQEGEDPAAERAFREMARLSRGAWFRFDRQSAHQLKALLGAVAVYAAGGLKALSARGRPEDRLMIQHLGGGA